jgi:hypothetical protein
MKETNFLHLDKYANFPINMAGNLVTEFQGRGYQHFCVTDNCNLERPLYDYTPGKDAN